MLEFGMFFCYFIVATILLSIGKFIFNALVNKIAVLIIKRQIQNGTIKVLHPTEFDLLDNNEKGH